MIVAFTGHRPNKLGGYNLQTKINLMSLAEEFLFATLPASVISGMALGWDTAVAKAALKLGIPVVAAVPFIGQEKMWPLASREEYREILSRCATFVVSPGSYTDAAMQKRIEWMVDQSDQVCALWDGSQGGTGNCVGYATEKQRPTINLWNTWKEKYAMV